MIKITHFKVRTTRKPKKTKYHRTPFFELDLEFNITDDNKNDNLSCFYDQLDETYKTMYMKDHKGYKKEISQKLKKHKNDFMKAINAPMKHRWESIEIPGIDMIQKEKKGKTTFYKFHEYFTDTRVTRSIVNEIRRIKRNPNHSFKTIPEQYLAHLLISLSYFWD